MGRLSLVTFLPLLAALGLLAVPRTREGAIRWLALAATVATFVASLWLVPAVRPGQAGFALVEDLPWIRVAGLEIRYHLGVDGLSLWLVLLTTLLLPVSVAASWRAIETRVKEYYVLLLVLETAMVGTFLALDLFLFYVFWEAMLVPMYFVIGVWGGPRRIYAAIKFVLYTVTGSLLMLVGILVLVYLRAQATGGPYAFDLLPMYELALPRETQLWLFAAFALAFAIKVPMVPFHTWLPDAHVEAPTAGSVILAGVLLKMGTYGFLRFAMPLFPEAVQAFWPLVMALAVVGIVYGAWMATAQSDVKKLVAYSSVSHLGFVMMGLFALTPMGVSGAILQMVNHGLSTGALFLLVGMLYERRHTREIGDFGGIARQVPLFAVFLVLVALSSIGLPGLNGFVGEFLTLVGTFTAEPPASRWIAAAATTGMLWSAIYMLWMVQRVLFGPLDKAENRTLADLDRREVALLLPVALLIVWIGVYPGSFLRPMEGAVGEFVARVEPQGAVARGGPGPQSPPPG
ncbi:MAG TPA: NADH-quinone oxidoreductase subunit M, partial [Thermodesulfobacteriota bacterium]|nr:NADH-quinone oxidoreductase subunit M [Thermodesulfobacteriota bacterium]